MVRRSLSGGITAGGGNPILVELNLIFNWWIPQSIILIDDARLFNGKDNWPNINEIKNITMKNEKNLKIKDDIIIIGDNFININE